MARSSWPIPIRVLSTRMKANRPSWNGPTTMMTDHQGAEDGVEAGEDVGPQDSRQRPRGRGHLARCRAVPAAAFVDLGGGQAEAAGRRGPVHGCHPRHCRSPPTTGPVLPRPEAAHRRRPGCPSAPAGSHRPCGVPPAPAGVPPAPAGGMVTTRRILVSTVGAFRHRRAVSWPRFSRHPATLSRASARSRDFHVSWRDFRASWESVVGEVPRVAGQGGHHAPLTGQHRPPQPVGLLRPARRRARPA